MNKKINRGLTLIEVMITTFMVALIGMAVYSALNNGIKAWQRVGRGTLEEDVVFFYDRFFRDITNSFRFPGMAFTGNEKTFSIPTIVRDRAEYGDPGEGPGKCTYLFEPEAKRLDRAQETYSDIYQARDPEFSPVLAAVDSVTFSYYYFDTEKQDYIWSKTWPPEEGNPQDMSLPLSIRATLVLEDLHKTYEYTKTVSLPLAGQ